MPNKNILIAGYYGFDLLGDEAILQAMLCDLRKLEPDCHCIVTSQSPKKTKKTYGINAINLYDMEKIIDILEKVDLVVVGGGGVFNEYSRWRSEFWLTLHQDFNVFCSSLPILAAAHKKPCMIYGVGVEPLYSSAAKRDVANAFAVAMRATVRDHGSLNILKSIGIPIERVTVTADPAFELPNINFPTEKLLTRHGIIVTKPVIGVSLRHWNPDRWDNKDEQNLWEAEVSTALDTFVKRNGGTLILIPFQRSPQFGPFADDLPVLRRVRKKMEYASKVYILGERLLPGEVAHVLADCDLVLAMRFHSVVLAVKNATPCVAIAYSLKVKTAMERSGLGEFTLSLKNLSAERLIHALENCYVNRKQLRNKLNIVSKEMKQLAFENAKLAVGLLNGQRRKNIETIDELSPALITRQTKLLVKMEKEIVRKQREIKVFHTMLRYMLDEQQQYKAVEVFSRNLLRINSNQPEWNYLFAFCLHMQTKDLDKAIRHYDLALEKGFSEFWVCYHRGVLYLELGNFSEARADLERAIELDHEYPGLHELIQCTSILQRFQRRGRRSIYSSRLNRLIIKLVNKYGRFWHRFKLKNHFKLKAKEGN